MVGTLDRGILGLREIHVGLHAEAVEEREGDVDAGLPVGEEATVLAEAAWRGAGSLGVRRAWQVATALVLVAVLAWPAGVMFSDTRKTAQETATREQARVWVATHLPANVPLALESYTVYPDAAPTSVSVMNEAMMMATPPIGKTICAPTFATSSGIRNEPPA